MALKFYMDHNIPRSITQGLRIKHVDVLTAFEDGQSKTDDAALLQRATALNRVLFSMDDDLLGIAASLANATNSFCRRCLCTSIAYNYRCLC